MTSRKKRLRFGQRWWCLNVRHAAMLNQPNRLGNEVMISFARRDIVSQLSVSKGGLNQHVRRKGRLPLHLCLAPKAQRSA